MKEQEDEPEQPERAERSSSNLFSSESDPNDLDSDESDKPFDIVGLLDKRTVDDVIEYEVQWAAPYVPSWQPAANISAEAIAEFEKKNAAKAKKGKGNAKKGKTKRGRPKGSKKKEKTEEKKPLANAPRTRSVTKAAQQKG